MSHKKDDLHSSHEFLRNLFDRREDVPNLLEDEPWASPEHDLAEMLRDRCQRLLKRQAFSPGDLVTWKPGMSNARFPRQGKPAVVIEVLAEPVLDTRVKPGYTYFREPLDIVLGVIVESGPRRGDFLYWHFDSRRFQHWQPREVQS